MGAPLSIETLELDEPREREALVRIVAAGVCHSDLHVMKGDLPIPLPAVLGHEGSAVVERVGPGVTTVKPGDHCILVFAPNCGHCAYCTAGRPMLCTGHGRRAPGTMLDGTYRLSVGGAPVSHMAGISCFAEHAVIAEEQLLVIDSSIPLDKAALVGCSVTTGIGAVVNTARVEPGATVAVIGCGGVGLSVVQGARLAGAARIVAIDLFDEKLEKATSMGATDVVNANDGDVVKRVRQLTAGGADYAFDAIGMAATVKQSLDVVRAGGKAVVIGVGRFGEGTPIDAFSLVMQEKSLLGCFYGSSRPRIDMPRILALYRHGRLQLDEMVTRRYPLERINEAYADLQGSQAGRGVITF
ncbi:MAG TPA: Zn-dependent alcohol dehydrogenase [Candidatus Dormibacteraeota bacterium]